MAEESANKRIAKNTIFLYFRSLLIMAVTLFSSRIILQALGVDDYGLYGAVGSIVMMFTIINNTLAVGTSRFLTFELGKKDEVRLKKTFSAAFTMHVAMALILFVLLETIGLWFVNNKMQIPEGRVFAANVIYQLSIVACMFNLTQVPYSALIIAHEKMSIYAYVGIAEAVFKLALIFVLLYVPFRDNLIAYGIILAAWSIGLQIFYRFYCRRHFAESKLKICRDKSVYKGMLTYSLWDFIGQFCATGNNQGTNILINMFFGVTVNAARTVAYQVETALTQFSNNFLTAVNPQIVKSYAQNDHKRFFELIFESGKYAYYLLFLVSLPVFLEAKYILSIWLVEVPDYTVLFLRCVIAENLFRILNRPIILGVHATGNVRYLNLTSGIYGVLAVLPIVYVLFKLGFPVWSYFIVRGINALVLIYLEMKALYINVNYNRLAYIKKVYIHVIFVSLLIIVVPIALVFNMSEGFTRLILSSLACVISTIAICYSIGISQSMRLKLNGYIMHKFFHK